MSAKKAAFMRWIEGELRADKDFARRVDELVNEMKIEQELVALRERRGISQRAAAKLIGASQPFVAKLESGRVKNLGVKTLVKYATALGGKLTLRIDLARVGSKTTRRNLRRAS
jgi:predicted XRE-type DNA-binding protein